MRVTVSDVTVRQQVRQSLALRATPEGLVAFIPDDLDPSDQTVLRFIERGIECLPAPEPVPEPMTPSELDRLIAAWAQRLGVGVGRSAPRDAHQVGLVLVAGHAHPPPRPPVPAPRAGGLCALPRAAAPEGAES